MSSVGASWTSLVGVLPQSTLAGAARATNSLVGSLPPAAQLLTVCPTVSELLLSAVYSEYGYRHAASAICAGCWVASVALAMRSAPSDVMPGEIFRLPCRRTPGM